MMEWGRGFRDSGDAAVDLLEVYMNYHGLDENNEERYCKLNVSDSLKLTALAQKIQLLHTNVQSGLHNSRVDQFFAGR